MFALLLGCAPSTTINGDAAAPATADVPDPTYVADAHDPEGPDDGGGPGDPGDEDTALPVDAGACTGFTLPATTGRLPDGLDEVSGLVASRRDPGVLWMIEDSGNLAELYALDIDGNLLATVRLPVSNVDWEDLAIAPCGDVDCLWIADVGDNNLVRNDAVLYVVEEPALADGTADLVDTVPVRYAEGPHNVEALVVSAAGVPTLFSKQDDGKSWLLREVAGRFVRSGSLDVAAAGDDAWSSRVTAADLWPDDRSLLLRTYGHAWRYPLTPDGVISAPESPVVELRAAAQAQVEAVAWDPTLRGWWQTSEGDGADLLFTACDD